MLAMTYMYNGSPRSGRKLAYRVWYNLTCIQGYAWDAPNIMRGDADTGERSFGQDYVQNMILWSLPARSRAAMWERRPSRADSWTVFSARRNRPHRIRTSPTRGHENQRFRF